MENTIDYEGIVLGAMTQRYELKWDIPALVEYLKLRESYYYDAVERMKSAGRPIPSSLTYFGTIIKCKVVSEYHRVKKKNLGSIYVRD